MKKVVSLSTYLSSYNLDRKEFEKVIEKDRAFYDKYIDWGKNDSETILSPKALDALGEIFNDRGEEMTITINGEVKDSINLSDPVKPKRKRRTKAEMEAARASELEQQSISDYMTAPVPIPEKKQPNPKPKTVPKKRSKLNITKQFIQEHGKCSLVEGKDVKSLRTFLINSGLYKLEQIALMSDQDVVGALDKDFYFIDAPEGTYIFRKSAILGIVSDVYFVGSDK